MNWAVWTLCGFGVFFLACLGFVLLLGCIGSLRDFRTEHHQRSFDAGRKAMLYGLGQDAWWFSEDTPTRNMLSRLAAGQRVDGVREKWRAEREQQLRGQTVRPGGD